MAVRPVLRLPHPVLQQVAQPVGAIDDDARRLAEDLLETMAVSPACVGLAANQIGSTRRAFCVDVTGHKKAKSCHGAFVLFDPRLLVARAPDPADRRNKVVSLTPAGRRLLARCRTEIRAMEEDLLAAIAPADRATFVRVLTALGD